MIFRVYTAELVLQCPRDIHFAPFTAANWIRGQFGKELFEDRPQLYRQLFAPLRRNSGPSGLADPPRPFCLRTRHLDGRSFAKGEPLPFRIHLFSQELTSAFGPIPLTQIDLPLSDPGAHQSRLQLEFLSPTELKNAELPDFGPLLSRLRDRISTLMTLYGGISLDLDFRGVGERAGAVRCIASNLRRVSRQRRSGSNGSVHPLGGMIGSAVYEGELGEFLPFLEVGAYTGVGRYCVWGNGEIRVSQEIPATLLK